MTGVGTFRPTSRRVIHEWASWRLVTCGFIDPDGEVFERTYVESPGVVAIAALDGDRRLVMVRQYRPALDQVLWEIPAGMRDVVGESALDCAKRELVEETGYTADVWAPLNRVAQSPGTSNSVADLFLARNLTPGATDRMGPEEAHASVHLVPIDEAVRMVEDGEVVNALAVAGILLARRVL